MIVRALTWIALGGCAVFMLIVAVFMAFCVCDRMWAWAEMKWPGAWKTRGLP